MEFTASSKAESNSEGEQLRPAHGPDEHDTPALHGYDGVAWARLSGYGVPADNYEAKSWVWLHGWRLWEKTDNSIWWLCKECHSQKRTNKRLQEQLFSAGGTTSSAIYHLTNHHNYSRNGAKRPEKTLKRKWSVLDQIKHSPLSALENKIAAGFDINTFRALFYKWLIAQNIPFRQVDSAEFGELLKYLNPRATVPHSTTVSRTINLLYDHAHGNVCKLLELATSKISLSFDLWTSGNKLALLGLVAHFISADGKPTTLLVALPRQRQRHSGYNIADTIANIIAEYDIKHKLGWFVADNASNNKACLEHLGSELDFNPDERWLRCTGHVINLVAQQVLFGSNAEAFELDAEYTEAEDARIRLWRKRGPIGKLHNTVHYINRSTTRHERFLALQTQLLTPAQADDTPQTYELVTDVTTRWNSFVASATRALYLRAAIDEFIQEIADEYDNYVRRAQQKGQKRLRAPPTILADKLSADDWHVISEYVKILQPLEKATLLLQGYAGGRFGAIWQVLPVYEQLLAHFEQLKRYYSCDIPDDAGQNYFTTNINLGWAKLNEYYLKLDRSPVYVAAIVLHPRMKWHWIQQRWKDRPDWLITATSQVYKLWTQYQLRPTNDSVEARSYSTSGSLTERTQRGSLAAEFLGNDYDDEVEEPVDEFAAYTAEPRALKSELDIDQSAVLWWRERQHRWPKLAAMALDIFAIPAMSDEPERVFSLTGRVVTPCRRCLKDHTVQSAVCLHCWVKDGTVRLDGDTFSRICAKNMAKAQDKQ